MVVVVVDLGLYKYSKVSKNINYKGFMLMTTLKRFYSYDNSCRHGAVDIETMEPGILSEQSRCMEHNNFLEIGNIHILDFHCISPAQ